MLLALDPSSQCGWALVELAPAREPRMTCGSWDLAEGTNAERAGQLARHIAIVLSRNRNIKQAVIEVPMIGRIGMVEHVNVNPGEMFGTVERRPAGNPKTDALLWSLHGACIAACAIYKVPWHTVGSKEWRKAMFGNGNIAGKEAKRRSKEELRRIGVEVANVNQAEAGMIGWWGKNNLKRLNAERDYLNAESLGTKMARTRGR